MYALWSVPVVLSEEFFVLPELSFANWVGHSIGDLLEQALSRRFHLLHIRGFKWLFECSILLLLVAVHGLLELLGLELLVEVDVSAVTLFLCTESVIYLVDGFWELLLSSVLSVMLKGLFIVLFDHWVGLLWLRCGLLDLGNWLWSWGSGDTSGCLSWGSCFLSIDCSLSCCLDNLFLLFFLSTLGFLCLFIFFLDVFLLSDNLLLDFIISFQQFLFLFLVLFLNLLLLGFMLLILYFALLLVLLFYKGKLVLVLWFNFFFGVIHCFFNNFVLFLSGDHLVLVELLVHQFLGGLNIWLDRFHYFLSFIRCCLQSLLLLLLRLSKVFVIFLFLCILWIVLHLLHEGLFLLEEGLVVIVHFHRIFQSLLQGLNILLVLLDLLSEGFVVLVWLIVCLAQNVVVTALLGRWAAFLSCGLWQVSTTEGCW